jgi:predicted nucleic acid-binding protein
VRVAFDTNILAYAEGLGDEARCAAAVRLVGRFGVGEVVLPVQVLGELSRVLLVKAKRPASEVRKIILDWADSFEIVNSTWPAFAAALDLMVDHRLSVWDAMILSAAAENGCRHLFSEDFQNGFTWRGITIVDPFA